MQFSSRSAVQVVLLSILGACTTPRGDDAVDIAAQAPRSHVAIQGRDTLSLAPGPHVDIVVGDTLIARATLTGRTGPVVSYTSTDPTVAVVDSLSGQLIGRNPGSTTIVARSADPDLSVRMEVRVMTQRQMVGETIAEICINEDEADRATFTNAESPISSDVRVVHEFHDCQRLIRDGKYASVVGIFAHRNLSDYENALDYVAGRLAAIIINFRIKDQFIVYEPLRLTTPTNCLIIRYVPSDEKWEAALIHVPPPSAVSIYGDCPDTLKWSNVETHAEVTRLLVKKQLGVDPYGRNIAPPVARWDWDPVHLYNYIGVRCDSVTWCEIGPEGFEVSPPLLHTTGKGIFKGYYDQQLLADDTGNLSDVWGTLAPDTDLVRGNLTRNGKWYKAIRIEIRTANASSAVYKGYRRALNLKSVKATAGQRDTGQLKLMSMGKPGDDWMVRINGNTVEANQGLMKFRSHPSDKGARVGTVRWRWLERDETVWSYCSEDGCCEMGRLRLR